MTSRERELERKLNLIVEALGGEDHVEQMVMRRVSVQPQVTQQGRLGFVHTAETFYRDPDPTDPTPLPFVPARYWNTSGRPYREPRAAAPTDSANATIHARVYEGRWIVDCPDMGCGGAHVASSTDRRFFCNQCHNHGVGGRWVTVLWPSEEERQTIERLLLLRPMPNRNWWPGETVGLLRAENIEHGLAA